MNKVEKYYRSTMDLPVDELPELGTGDELTIQLMEEYHDACMEGYGKDNLASKIRDLSDFTLVLAMVLFVISLIVSSFCIGYLSGHGLL